MNVTDVEEFITTEGYTGWEFPEDFECLASRILLYQGRWVLLYLDVWADPDGHVFGIQHEHPATEMQEGSEGEPLMTPVQVVTSWDVG